MAQTIVRPEVQLGTCPRDAGDMFRLYAEKGHTWVCGQCGLVTHGDPREASSVWDAITA